MTQWKGTVNFLSQLCLQTNEMTTDGSHCMLIKSMCFKSACRELTLGSTRYSVWFPFAHASHQIPACATHISFTLLMRPCHSWIPPSQLALRSKSVFWNQSVLLLCQFSAPEYRPYMIICCLGYCSQNMAYRLRLAEFPRVPLACRFLGPPPDWLHQNLRRRDLKICTVAQHPKWLFKDIKVRKALP